LAYLYFKDMSNVLDRVFAEVCLDERITDGVFRMDETEHMNALRDFFVKKGITKDAAITVTNRMVEGKYPDRQAYRKEDGILVTWPSPKHKHKAMHENPGKYVEENPFPKRSEPTPEPKEREPRKEKEPPVDDTEEPDDTSTKKPGSNLFGGGESGPQLQQGDKQLSIEPIKGTQPIAPAAPPIAPQQPRTPERIAAEKEVAQQIVATGDDALTNVANPLTETYRQQIIKELYTKADKLGLKEVVTFLTPYVKP
jgi:hypothetical protein